MTTSVTNGGLALISQVAIEANKGLSVPYTIFSRSAQVSETLDEGDIVKVFVAGKAPTATVFNASTNNYNTDNGVAHVFKSITLGKCLKSGFAFPARQWKKLSAEQQQSVWNTHTAAVYEAGLIKIMNLITAANFGSAGFTGSASTFDSTSLTDLMVSLMDAKGSRDSLSAVLKSTYYGSLLKDNAFRNLAASGDQSVIRDGVLNGGVGFSTIAPCSIIPANSENLVGFVTDGSAIAVANVVVDPRLGNGADTFDHEISYDPTSGFYLGFGMQRDPDTHDIAGYVEAYIDVCVGNASNLLRIVSA